VNGFDPATPNTARVYCRLLGGKDHFPPDRAEADVLLEIYPPLAEMARENRAFLAEAVTWAAGQGISQFLDLGAGLPAKPRPKPSRRPNARPKPWTGSRWSYRSSPHRRGPVRGAQHAHGSDRGDGQADVWHDFRLEFARASARRPAFQ
jgi:S-adenosyl methyltransferase